MQLADIEPAFMYAKSETVLFAEPPKELRHPDWLWAVKKAMNGRRTASRDFNHFFSETRVDQMRMIQGVIDPCLFRAKNDPLRVATHVDDPIGANLDFSQQML